MKKIIFVSIFFLAPLFALGSEGAKNYDIVWRSLNFIIFYGALFYFLKKPVTNWYYGRKNAIANELNKVNEDLENIKKLKEQSIEDIKNAQVEAQNIINNAKIQAQNIEFNSKNQIKKDINIMQENFENLKDIEKSLVTKRVVKNLLDDIFAKKDVNEDKLVDIVLKKVG